MFDELQYIEREAREQGEADYTKELAAEAFTLFSRLCGIYWKSNRIQRQRIGKIKYQAWKRWQRRLSS